MYQEIIITVAVGKLSVNDYLFWKKLCFNAYSAVILSLGSFFSIFNSKSLQSSFKLLNRSSFYKFMLHSVFFFITSFISFPSNKGLRNNLNKFL